MSEVVLSRTVLTLPNLVIPSTPGGAYWHEEGGIILPESDHRVTFADDSAHVAGSLPTQAVATMGALAVTVYTEAADLSTLKAQQDALKSAISQFNYTATVTLYGTETYTCLPGRLSWGPSDSGMLARRLAKGVLTIPTQPLEV